LDRDYKIECSTEHRAKFRADRPTELGDYAAKKKKKKPQQNRSPSENYRFRADQLEIWGKAQRESARRPKSDWGKLEGGKNFPGIKVTWPELKCIGIRRTRIVDLG